MQNPGGPTTPGFCISGRDKIGSVRRHNKPFDLADSRIVAYRERNRIIRAMGFADYKAYLRSPLWASIRARKLAAEPDCFACGAHATQVHHAKYRKNDLQGRCLDFLFAVCSACHGRFEFRDSDKAKLTPKQATSKMRAMRTQTLKDLAARSELHALDSEYRERLAREP